MTRLWSSALRPRTVCVSELISERAERLYHGLAASQDLLEYLLGVVVRSQLQDLGELAIKGGKVVGLLPAFSCLIKDPLADVLKKCARKRYCALGLGRASFQGNRPAGMNLAWVECGERRRN